ncbi:CheR family methyltransferase, partial [Thermodesulfobacteriota bacterium]
MPDLEIETLLQKIMGLKVTSIGKGTLDRSVQKRMKALSIISKKEYVEKLHSSVLELKELIEEVIIPETWFFRDQIPFKVISQFLVTQWLPKHKNKLFRVLSAPCSSGEEPYSMAMTLLDAGLSADKFSIHGVDISTRSILRAQKGIYTKHSFRGTDVSYQRKFFEKDKNFFILNKNVCDNVHFHIGNILNSTFMEGLGLFDVVFFRNVLIYFNERARHQAIATLYKILADDGILFVGHAEANLFNNSPFTPAPYSQAFAFHKKSKRELAAKPGVKEILPTPAPQKSRTQIFKKTFPFKKKTKENQPDLKVARELADKGELQKATKICEAYLDQHGPSAKAYFLLGIIHDADDDILQAEKLFRKALYLDPYHEEAL